jgi:hypothetical protein
MKVIEVLAALLIGGAMVNVIFNSKNTVPIENATFSGTSQVLGTLTATHNSYGF